MPLGDQALEFGDRGVEELGAFPHAAQHVDGAHHVDRVEVGVEGRRVALAELLGARVALLGPRGVAEDLAQLVDVELLPGHRLAERDQLLELRHDVGDVGRARLGGPAERDVQHEELRARDVRQVLEPLHVHVAADVVAHGDRGVRQRLARPHAALEEQADVGLDVRAVVARVARLLGLEDQGQRLLPDGVLERRHLGEHRQDVAGAQELDAVAGDHERARRDPVGVGAAELVHPRRHEPARVLVHLALVLPLRDRSRHGASRVSRRAWIRRRSRSRSACARRSTSFPRTPRGGAGCPPSRAPASSARSRRAPARRTWPA